MGRTIISVGHLRRIVRYGDARILIRWSDNEDRVIRECAGTKTAEAIAELLPGRTPKSVRGRIHYLGIKLGYFYAARDPHIVGDRPLLAKTCSKCGLLLPSEWFLKTTSPSRRRSGKEYWRDHCRKCSHRGNAPRVRQESPQAREWTRKAQAITLPLAVNNGKEYTEADYVILADENLSNLAKALILKRSYKAASGKVSEAGYKSRRGLGSAARDQWLIDNPNADRIDEITAMLNEVEPSMPTRPDFEWDD